MYKVGDYVYVVSVKETGYVLEVLGDGRYQVELDSMQTVTVHSRDMRPIR